LALVQDRVEGIGGVASEEVAAGGGAVAVQDEGLAAVEEAGELRDDL
jgi:hypothetical protein